jgi:hypothetical protein
MDSKALIDALGGPVEVAAMFDITPQAVSQWYGLDDEGNERTIPKARLMYLRAIKSKVVAQFENKERANG